jgi:predicted PurR-regulated permease PerM
MKPVSSSEKIITWTTSQVVLATVFVVCVFLIFWLLYRLSFLIFLLFVAIVIGTALRPMVEWLQRRGVSRMMGVIIIYILLASFVVGFLALIFPVIADQATQLSQNLPEYYTEIRRALVNSDNRLLQNVAFRMPEDLSLLIVPNTDTGEPEVLLTQVSQTVFYGNAVVKGILSVLAVFLLAYYWTQESAQVVRAVIRLVPLHRRKETQEFLQLAERKIGGYVRGQGILCVIVGLAAFVFYSLIGLPYTLVLAMFAGLMEMVPVFGPALGAVPALVAALSTDPSKAIWVLVVTGLIQMMENLWLVPRIMKNSMGVNPIIILLSLVAFGTVFGFAGAVLALPLAAIIQLILDRILISAENSNDLAPDLESDVPSMLDESKRLLQILDGTSNNKDVVPGDISEEDQLEIQSITQELDRVLDELKNEGEML